MEEQNDNQNTETNTDGVGGDNQSTPVVMPKNASFSTMPVVRQLAIIAVLLVGIFGFGAGMLWLDGENIDQNDISTDLNNNSNDFIVEDRLSFDEIELLAHKAIVVDVSNGLVLYEKAADESWPLASITKLMTALVASEIVNEDSVIPITTAAVEQAGEGGVLSGESFSYKNLSDLMLLVSSNDGAYALGAYAGGALNSDSPETAFVEAMNVRAKELGLSKTYFRNPTGLDLTESEAGAYGSARDVATLLEYILDKEPQLLEMTTKAEAMVLNENGQTHDASNTNYVVEAIPNAIASKTGYTTLSGGNLVVAYNVGFNRPVIAVVLGSTHQGRFSDILKLVEASRNEIINNQEN